MKNTKMKNSIPGRTLVGALLMVVSALPASAALIAYEGFDCDGSGAITGENAGAGWTAVWDATGVTGLPESGSDRGPRLDQAPALIPDGSPHVTSNANLGNDGVLRRRR